jgi:hypothetical protein
MFRKHLWESSPNLKSGCSCRNDNLEACENTATSTDYSWLKPEFQHLTSWYDHETNLVSAATESPYWRLSLPGLMQPKMNGVHLEEQEGDPCTSCISFGPTGHPKLSDGWVSSWPGAQLCALATSSCSASILLSEWGTWHTASGRQSTEVKVILQQMKTALDQEH